MEQQDVECRERESPASVLRNAPVTVLIICGKRHKAAAESELLQHSNVSFLGILQYLPECQLFSTVQHYTVTDNWSLPALSPSVCNFKQAIAPFARTVVG